MADEYNNICIRAFHGPSFKKVLKGQGLEDQDCKEIINNQDWQNFGIAKTSRTKLFGLSLPKLPNWTKLSVDP